MTAGAIDALTNLVDAEVGDPGNQKIWRTTIFWKRYNFISPRVVLTRKPQVALDPLM